MKKALSTFIIVIASFFFFCWIPGGKVKGYKLNFPDSKVVLPAELHEISGLVILDTGSFACVQDEKGIIYTCDVATGKIISQRSFNMDGDYEGITRVGDQLVVLRSDGVLFSVSDEKNAKARSFNASLPCGNSEGLCFDADSGRLLLACKAKSMKGVEYRDKREVYGFNLATGKRTAQPVFVFDTRALIAKLAAKNVPLPVKEKKKGAETVFKLRISAIAIHPVNKKFYVLSAADHMLCVFSMKGEFISAEPLDPVMFNKPEGISFFPNGDMLITNEGQTGSPTLLRFNYKVLHE